MPDRPPKVALLGATGRVGRAFLGNLSIMDDPWPVTALVRNIPEQPLPFVEYVRGALPSDIPKGFPPPGTDVVVHLANAQNERDQPLLNAVNVDGTAALLCAMPPSVKAVVYGSSMSVYGQGAQQAVTEAHPLRPETALARSRLAAEQLVLTTTAARTAGAYLLRPRFLTGADDRSFLSGIRRLRSLPLSLRGDAVRLSIIDFDDYGAVITALVAKASTAPNPVRRALNVSYREPLTLNQLFELTGPPTANVPRVLPSEAVIALCRLLPGASLKRLRVQLELVTRSHWADTSALAAEIGNDIVSRSALETLRAYETKGDTP